MPLRRHEADYLASGRRIFLDEPRTWWTPRLAAALVVTLGAALALVAAVAAWSLHL